MSHTKILYLCYQACGAKLITNDSGIITSDSLTIGMRENCSWTIISGIPESKITLTFTHLDLVHYSSGLFLHRNESNECMSSIFSRLRILDGPDSGAPEILKLCKSNPIPAPITSNGPAMRIEFVDRLDSFDSFTALYSVRSVGQYDYCYDIN